MSLGHFTHVPVQVYTFKIMIYGYNCILFLRSYASFFPDILSYNQSMYLLLLVVNNKM